MSEIWKSVIGYEGLYAVSSLGRIMSFKKGIGKLRKPCVTKKGYCRVTLYNSTAKMKTVILHRLVAIAFLPNPNKLKEVNHIDYNKENNRIENLEWCSRLENARHSHMRIGRVYSNHRKGFIGKLSVLSMPVRVKDLDGQLIAEYESMEIAAKSIGVATSRISECCNGIRKTHKGKIFEKI